MTRFRATEPPSQSPPPGRAGEGAKSPASHGRHDEQEGQEGQEQHEWTVDEEGIVDEPSDRSGPDFNDDLDPPDAP